MTRCSPKLVVIERSYDRITDWFYATTWLYSWLSLSFCAWGI